MCEISIESEINKNIENSMSDSLVSIEINDIFDELNEENYRLRKQLFLSNKYNTILEKFKQYLDLNSNKCQCFESNRNQLNLIYDEFNEFFNEENNYFEQNYREIINYLNSSKNKDNNDNNNSNKLIIKPIVNKARKSFNSQLNNSNYNNNNNSNNNNNNEKSSICESKVKKEVKYPWNPRHRCLWIGCNFKTDKKKVLNDHMNIHKEVRPYLCTDGKCGKTFFSEKSLKAHRKRHLTGKRYKLSTINEELASSKTYFETKKFKLKSIKSAKIVKNKSEIKVEELDNNSTEVQMNNNRDINSNIDNNNNNTVKKYGRNLRHKCCWVGCDFKTEKKLILKDHMNIHKNIRPYVCQEPNCGKRYFSSKSLGSHRKRHLNTGSYKCSYSECSFNGRTLNIVMAHIKLLHSVDKPYYCSHCELYFETEFSFKRHLVSHLETNYKCDYPNCPYRSNQLSKFNVHLRKHTGEKPFKCEWPGCEKIFSRLDGLKDHQIRHSDLRPFHCSWPGCESKFKRANDLKMHCMSSFDLFMFLQILLIN
jgi:hypothetical protein